MNSLKSLYSSQYIIYIYYVCMYINQVSCVIEDVMVSYSFIRVDSISVGGGLIGLLLGLSGLLLRGIRRVY